MNPARVIIAQTRLQSQRSIPESYLLTQRHRTDQRRQLRVRRWYSRGRPPSGRPPSPAAPSILSEHELSGSEGARPLTGKSRLAYGLEVGNA